MPKYRYRPEDNRTPVIHPTIGHLDYDGVYDHPDCAGHPDFVEVHDKKILKDDDAARESPANPEMAVEAPDPVTTSPGDTPTKAGKTGGSK
jgi:hypothetical protein